MKLRSGIARIIDVRHASNRFALLAPVVGGSIHFAAAAFTGSDFPASFRASFLGGGATFLGWAIGRELDPDDPVGANIAAVLAFAFAFLGDPFLAIGGVALIAARIVARTTGLPPQPIDLFVLVVAAGYVATRPAGALVIVGLAVTLAADRMLPGTTPGINMAAGLAVVIVGVSAALAGGSWPHWASPSVGQWAILFAGATAAAMSFSIPEPASAGDYTDQKLHHTRTQAARAGTLVVALGYGLAGGVGISGLAPVWAAFLGAAATAVRRRL